MLPSNQQGIIEQAKFTYSALGKVFEKQVKTIEDQGEKQIDALEDLKPKEQTAIDYEDKLLILKEQEIFKNIYNKRLDKIKDLGKKIDDKNFVFTTISTGRKTDLSRKYDPLALLNKIKKGEITIEEAKESQKDFNNYLKMVGRENKNKEQEKTLKNINMFFDGRKDAINFIKDYGSMILEANKNC